MYLNNKDLYIEIIVSKAQGKLTRNAEKMLELLAKKTIKKMRYWSNDDKKWNELTKPNTYKAMFYLYQTNNDKSDMLKKIVNDFNFSSV